MPVSKGSTERLALEVSDLMRLLPLKRAAAYKLARQLGVRVGRRRILIPRARFDAWLASGRIEQDQASRRGRA